MKRLLFTTIVLALALSLRTRAASDFAPLMLGPGANTAFKDQEPKDRKGGWTDQGSHDLSIIKPGILTVSGIPFQILDDKITRDKSCIVLGGPKREYLPTEATVAADGHQGRFVHLLHAAAWCPKPRDRKNTGTLKVAYMDGKSQSYTVRFGRDIANWEKPNPGVNAVRVWSEYNGSTQVSLFASKFKLEEKPLASLTFTVGESAWMIVAVTIGNDAQYENIHYDLTLDKQYIAPALDKPLVKFDANATPRNIILIIGDGMGPGAIQLTSLYQHKAEGRLVMEQLPVNTCCNTLSEGEKVTDSAASATAIATGHKTFNGTLGLNVEKKRIRSVAEAARQQGRAIAIMTSDSLLGATPAGFFAHVPSRGKLPDD